VDTRDGQLAQAAGQAGGEPGPDSDVVDEVVEGVGAYAMGRDMFGGGTGSWDEAWKGWWGENPPHHAPVFRADASPARAA